MGSDVGVVVRRLRARQKEIEDAMVGLREISRAQARLLDRLVIGVTREHVVELQHTTCSHEHRLLERVRILLAGEHSDVDMVSAGVDPELDYDLEGEHVGVIAVGAGADAAMQDVAESLQRRLLCVAHERGTVWAWLGGHRALPVAEIERACSTGATADVRFVLGEPGSGLEGWRATHRQAQVALRVAQRTSQCLTRYAEVALLAGALGDDLLAHSLREIFIAPLEDARGGGPALRETLRAYLDAECNASSAAVALKVARSTVVNRLRIAEQRLERTLHPCPAELEVALRLDALETPAGAEM
jgi:hypothetical protein